MNVWKSEIGRCDKMLSKKHAEMLKKYAQP